MSCHRAVEVRLFAYLRDNRGKKLFLNSSVVSDALEQLKIPPEEGYIILINGREATLQSALADKDVLSIFPQVGGG